MFYMHPNSSSHLNDAGDRESNHTLGEVTLRASTTCHNKHDPRLEQHEPILWISSAEDTLQYHNNHNIFARSSSNELQTSHLTSYQVASNIAPNYLDLLTNNLHNDVRHLPSILPTMLHSEGYTNETYSNRQILEEAIFPPPPERSSAQVYEPMPHSHRYDPNTWVNPQSLLGPQPLHVGTHSETELQLPPSLTSFHQADKYPNITWVPTQGFTHSQDIIRANSPGEHHHRHYQPSLRNGFNLIENDKEWFSGIRIPIENVSNSAQCSGSSHQNDIRSTSEFDYDMRSLTPDLRTSRHQRDAIARRRRPGDLYILDPPVISTPPSSAGNERRPSAPRDPSGLNTGKHRVSRVQNVRVRTASQLGGSSNSFVSVADQKARSEIYSTLESPFICRLRKHLPYPLDACFSQSRPGDKWQFVIEKFLKELSVDAATLAQCDSMELPRLLSSLCDQTLYLVERGGSKGGVTSIRCILSNCTRRIGRHNAARNLTHHLMKEHWRLNPFICHNTICGIAFAWPDDRARHEKEKHDFTYEAQS